MAPASACSRRSLDRVAATSSGCRRNFSELTVHTEGNGPWSSQWSPCGWWRRPSLHCQVHGLVPNPCIDCCVECRDSPSNWRGRRLPVFAAWRRGPESDREPSIGNEPTSRGPNLSRRPLPKISATNGTRRGDLHTSAETPAARPDIKAHLPRCHRGVPLRMTGYGPKRTRCGR